MARRIRRAPGLMAASSDRRSDNRRLEDQLLHWMAADSGEVLSVVDRAGQISYVTPSAGRLLGWEDGELQGLPADALFHPDDLPGLGGRARGEERRSSSRVRCKHRDGSWRTVEARVRPIFSVPGIGPIGLVVLSRDVTEQSAAHRELREKAQRLAEVEEQLETLRAERDELAQSLGKPADAVRESQRLKTEFLQSVRHELRTPLTSILGFSDLLTNDEALKGRSEIEIIRRNGRRLLTLIEDMLTLAQAQSGDLELRLAPTNVLATVRRVLETQERLAEQRGLELRLVAPPVGEVLAAADEGALTTILIHLLDNALKFTPAGSVDVAVEEIGPGVRVTVSDTGPGVPAEAREAIFRDFTQGDQTITRRHGGIGIGLSLAQRLVDLQGGEFGLEDRAGGGSTFWFILPGGAADRG